MSLQATYERFLNAPKIAALSDGATYSYVTSLQSFAGASQIIRHLDGQEQRIVKKKSWKVISSVVGNSSLALEIETTIEFISSGGAYLPGLDSFIVDHEATIPITHIVHFDRDDKISHVRLSWDQGSLLKQAEVIGARGRNWPVYDGKDQIKIIVSGSNSAAAIAPSTPPRGRGDEGKGLGERGFSPSKRHIRDPHASLDLFNPVKNEEEARTAFPDAIAPRASARPPPRDHSELFAAGNEELEPTPGGTQKVNVRESVIAPKGATSKRFESARLFEDDQDYKEPKIYKTNPARYNHFDLGDGGEDDPLQYKAGGASQAKKHVPLVSRTDKGRSQWDFEDFVTPAKVNQRQRDQDKINFDFDDGSAAASPNDTPGKPGQQNKARRDQEQHFELQDDGTPVERGPVQPKPRKDANTNFDFTDDPTPAPRRIIARTKAAAGLYANNQIYDEELEGDSTPLSNVTNKGRNKDFSAHWDATEDAPAAKGNENKPKSRVGKAFETHFSFGDEDQEQPRPARTNGRQQQSKDFWNF